MQSYKMKLKEEILQSLKELSPNNMMEHSRGECPECNEDDMYLYYPEYKYGRCNNCSYEVGFEYYSTVMGNKLDVYKKIKMQIEKTLKEI